MNTNTTIISTSAVERNVILYSHGGGKGGKATFKTKATTFGQLKTQLLDFVPRSELTYTENRIIEGNSKVSFETDDAILPENIRTKKGITNDLVIIIAPRQNIKSGALTRSECYETIKSHINQFGTIAKDHFLQHGQYTRVATVVLVDLITQFEKRKKVKETLANKVTTKVKKEVVKPTSKTVVPASKPKVSPVKEVLPPPVPEFKTVVEVPITSLEVLKEGINLILEGLNKVNSANIGVAIPVPQILEYDDQTNLSDAELREMAKGFK